MLIIMLINSERVLEIHYLFSQSTILMIEQQIGERMICPPLKLLKSIYLLLPMVLVRSFLTKLIFLLILFCVLTLFLQTNLAKLLRVGSTHPAPTLPPILHPHCHHQIVF